MAARYLSFFHHQAGEKDAGGGTIRSQKRNSHGIRREMGDWDSDELVLIQGIIDAWFEEEDGLILVDYKTDYVNDTQILVKRYKTQLDYYEKALTQMLGRNVKERYIYSYRLGLIAV
ncbi:MAG: hypothetical protein ACLTXS_15660 [[Clostridium] symbiosum]